MPSITHPPYLGALLHPPNPVEARKGTRNTVNRAVSMIPPHIDASRRVSFFTTGGELPRGWFERNLIPTKTLNWKRRYTGSVQYMYSTSQRVRGEYIYIYICVCVNVVHVHHCTSRFQGNQGQRPSWMTCLLDELIYVERKNMKYVLVESMISLKLVGSSENANVAWQARRPHTNGNCNYKRRHSHIHMHMYQLK